MTRFRSERLGGSRLATWSGLYAVGSLSRAVTGVLALPVLVGTLPPHEYAAIVLVTPIWWAGQPLLSLGASEGLSRTVVDQPRREVNGALFATALIVTVTTACLSLAVFLWSESILGIGWDYGIAAAMVIAGMQSLFACQLSIMRGTGLVRQATLALFGFASVPQVMGLVVLTREPHVGGYFVGYLLGLGAVLLYCLAACLSDTGISFTSRSRSVVRESCTFGLHATPQALSVQAVDVAVRRTALHVAGSGAVGTLGVAAACGGLVWNFIKALGQVWAPVVYAKSAADVRAFMQRSLELSCVVALPTVASGLVLLPAVETILPMSYDGEAFTSAAATYLLSAVTGLGLIAASTECLHLRRTSPMAWSSPIAAGIVIPVVVAIGLTGRWELSTLGIGLSLLSGTLILVAGTRSSIGLDYRSYYVAALLTLVFTTAASLSRHGGLTAYFTVTSIGFLMAAAYSARRYGAIRKESS